MSIASVNPTVAVSYVVSEGTSEGYRNAILELTATVVARLESRGVHVVRVNAAEADQAASELLASVDGLVVMGGADIDPSVYGESVTADNLHYLNASADQYEVDLVRAAASLDAPVFGICRGSQLINVAFGGNLIQDLGVGIHVAAVPGDDQPVDDAWANHSVDIVSGTKVAAMLGDEPIDARVGHHQAVDRVGDGLLVSARAEDGVVEAVESAEGWIVGVQWHPEEAKADLEALDRLIDGFLGAIAARQPQVA